MSLAVEVPPLLWDPSWGPAPKYSTPRHPGRKTYGGTIAKVSAMLRRPLFPWQRHVVDVAGEVDPDTGRLFYDTVVVLAQRRAGKTAMVQAEVAHRCGGNQRKSAWITAQDGIHAKSRWRDSSEDIVEVIGAPAVRRFIGVGNERVIWKRSRSVFRPFTPDEDAMHGEDPDLVFVDELWSFGLGLRDKMQEGYRPAWGFKEGQEWLLSAAGGPDSGWLKSARQAGRAEVLSGRQSRTAFFEWGVPEDVNGVPVTELDDERLLPLIVAHHPRPGIRTEHLESELADRSRSKILRAYGNIDEETDSREGVIPRVLMRAAALPDVIPPGSRVSLGVHVDPDRREASISAAWRNPEGVCLTTLLKRADGALWLPAAVRLLRDNPQFELAVVAGLTVGPARGEMSEMETAGIPLMKISAADMPAVCNRFVDEITARTVRHHAERELMSAVLNTAWRRRATGGRVFEADGEEPNTVLISHALAVWAADRMPTDERVTWGWSAF